MTNDQGNTGTGGPKSDTDTVGITVSGGQRHAGRHGEELRRADEHAAQPHGVSSTAPPTPTPANAGYTPSFTLAGVTVGSGPCAGCTISNVNAANGTVDVDPPGGATGSLTINYTITDSGNPGARRTSDPADDHRSTSPAR